MPRCRNRRHTAVGGAAEGGRDAGETTPALETSHGRVAASQAPHVQHALGLQPLEGARAPVQPRSCRCGGGATCLRVVIGAGPRSTSGQTQAWVLVRERGPYRLAAPPSPPLGPEPHRVTVTRPVGDKELRAAAGSSPEHSPHPPPWTLPWGQQRQQGARRVLPAQPTTLPAPSCARSVVGVLCLYCDQSEHFGKSNCTSCPLVRTAFLGSAHRALAPGRVRPKGSLQARGGKGHALPRPRGVSGCATQRAGQAWATFSREGPGQL